MIDLRSDTLTLPSKEMLATIATAQLGDDGRTHDFGRGEDLTVNKLEDLAAQITGKEAGVLFPTGTMGNSAAVLAFCQPGDKVLVDEQINSKWLRQMANKCRYRHLLAGKIL